MSSERQALIDMVPLLIRLAAGACKSAPYESCCRSCERLGEDALDAALDALSPFPPGTDRWSEPDEPRRSPVICGYCGKAREDGGMWWGYSLKVPGVAFCSPSCVQRAAKEGKR